MSCPNCKGLVADDIATVALSPTPAPQTTSKAESSSKSTSTPTLSNWEILEEIGRGGMGVVQRVRDKKLGRQAALKILLAGNANQQIEDRFLRESKVTANLDHPSIPAVFDAGRDESGQPYLLMRLVRGETLGHHIKILHQNVASDPRRYLEALVKVSEAVAHAHDRGIIHRDLKPENIMIGNYGDVLVMDWGLAGYKGENPEAETVLAPRPRLSLESTVSADPNSGDGDLTLAGTVMGTPGYMSPEQADGAWVDERSDVFALGAILTEILTGQSPISGTSAIAKIKNTLDGDYRYPGDCDTDSAPELDWIARQALAPDLEQRTISAALFIEQLHAFLSSIPVPGYPYSLKEKIEGWLGRHPFAVVVSSALTFILLISILYGLSWQAEKDARATAEAEIQRRKITENAFAQARSFIRRGRSRDKVVEKIKTVINIEVNVSVDEQLRAAEILEDAQAFAEAEDLLKRALTRNPEAVPILYSLHFVQLKKNGLNEQLFTQTDALAKLVELSKKSTEQNEYTHFAKAQELIQASNYKGAIDELDKIEDYTSALEGARIQKGICALELKNYKLATETMTKVILRNPQSKEAYFFRGFSNWKTKQFGNALADLNQVLSLDQAYPNSHYFKGLVRAARRDFTGAIADFKSALKLQPNNAQIYFARAKVFIQVTQFQEAFDDFAKALRLADLKDSWNKTQSFLNSAVTLKALKAKILCARARAYAEEGQKTLSIADLDLAEELQSSANVAFARAQCLRIGGDNDEAISYCNQALKLDENFAPAVRLRGEIYFAGPNTELAERDFDRLCQLEPENPQAHFYAALVKLRLGKLKESMKAHDRSIELDPGNPLRYFHRASARNAAKQYQSALEDLDFFIRNHPNHNQTPTARARAQQLRNYLKGQ